MRPGKLKPLIRKIWQKDGRHFSIEWTDGVISTYNLAVLQKNCPCAECAKNPPQMDETVSLHKIKSVGRYALRAFYTRGCSLGIYSYESLYEMAKEENACVL